MIEYKWLLMFIRWSLLIVFTLFLPKIIGIKQEINIFYRDIQWRIAIWLLLFELIINNDIILKLLNYYEL